MKFDKYSRFSLSNSVGWVAGRRLPQRYVWKTSNLDRGVGYCHSKRRSLTLPSFSPSDFLRWERLGHITFGSFPMLRAQSPGFGIAAMRSPSSYGHYYHHSHKVRGRHSTEHGKKMGKTEVVNKEVVNADLLFCVGGRLSLVRESPFDSLSLSNGSRDAPVRTGRCGLLTIVEPSPCYSSRARRFFS